MNELNHNSGKGDKERSPGWRRNYDEINFHQREKDNGFARRGNHLVKAYGSRVAKFVFPENEEQLLESALPYIAKHEAAPSRLIEETLHRGEAGFIEMGRPADCRNPCYGYICTLVKGHTGDHIAHTSADTSVARWKDYPQLTPADLSRYMLDNKIKL